MVRDGTVLQGVGSEQPAVASSHPFRGDCGTGSFIITELAPRWWCLMKRPEVQGRFVQRVAPTLTR